MKKTPVKSARAEMRSEYNFSQGVRGKYAQRYSEGVNIVALDADVAKVFPTSEAVNESLRALAGIIQRQKKVEASR